MEPTEQTAFAAAADRVAAGADPRQEAAALVAAMTLDEKLGCLDGDTPFWPGIADMTSGGYYEHPWPAAAVPRLGVPGVRFADGPRGCVVGRATCFPVSMARGASFDPDLERRVGEAIGAELRASGATLTGAVCVNLLRHPAWGRAQETYGEDPHHVGELGAALTEGLQRHVLASVKHFACNSMEDARFTVDVRVDERALHEVYLPHFRRVARAGVASVMSAYNRVNGEWCGEHHHLLTEVLREEWGWDGFVISDFVFGLRDPVASVRAGLDVEMPFRQQRAVALPDAIASGALGEGEVDRRVEALVATLLRFAPLLDDRSAPAVDVIASPAHRALAREAAVESFVLLRNEGPLLPADPEGLRRVAVLGRLAAVPNLGDGGSSDVHPPEVVTPLDGLRAALPEAQVVHHDTDASIAAGADLVVVVVGCTKADEGEYVDTAGTVALAHLFPPRDHPAVGFPPRHDTATGGAAAEGGAPAGGEFAPGGDRASLRLSPDDEALVRAATAASERVVVAVMGGSAVVMPWLDEVPATLLVWYPGLEGGHALADVVLGRAEPGGRLPFVLPADESQLVDFDRDATTATYDLLHGQWHLDATGATPARPFGFGLGYADVCITAAHVEVADDRGSGVADVEVTNRGDRPGATVVQVYAEVPGSQRSRPPRRLVGFAKVRAAAGATERVSIALRLDLLDVRVDGVWERERAALRLVVGRHAHDQEVVVEV